MSEIVVSVKNLKKSFKDFKALKDVSFSVYKNDVFGFLGPNGAGKSTSLRCMLSLIDSDDGQIEIFGKSLRKNRFDVLSNIGSIIEKPDFYKYLSAFKNLEIMARISGRQVSKSEIEDIIHFVGLKGREYSKFKTYSHGMKQRLGIAQALMHNPELIILDEPTTGLDPQGIVDIRELILKLSKEQGKTVILSSHQLSEIEMIANRMVIINKGKSIIEGDVNELLNSSQMMVKFSCEEPERFCDVMSKEFSNISEFNVTASEIEFEINREEISEINAFMVNQKIKISGIEHKRKLEDYFIKMIQNED
ncbi:ATP-binding cassette domain-containing protein [Crocinitomicaceae bacterium]|jgi:ABC-type multidrug transport system ATPase subunit|nr:ATP-binding cassette domain-containing protein [Crocinitomicaceae bacterium]MDC0302334.1 ATP-binding cassette domain-containing protein [bacterium]